MNIFNSILQKLGLQKPAAPVAAVAASTAKPNPAPAPAPAAPAHSASIGAPAPSVTSQFVEAQAPKTDVSEGASAQVTPAPVEPESFSVEPDPAPAVITPMAMVDVVSMLEEIAKSHPGADWKVSINDLLLMLGFEHSYEFRKELAAELGCPEDQMSDSARMNVWLHKTVLQKISENGGNIPQSLLD